jgi:chemotaxis signal transduction protein
VTTDNERLHELIAVAAEASPVKPEVDRPLQSLLVFRVGSRMFGAEARHVYEVVVSGSITQVPTARPYILGITLVRGRLVPVISLGELLGTPSGDEAAPTLPRLLILRHGTLEIAVMSDATLGLFDIGVTDLGSSTGPRPDCIAAELEFRGDLLVLLDIPALLHSVADDKGTH